MIECIKNPRASNCTMQKYDKEISWIKNTVAGSVHNALLTAGFEISLAEVRHLQALAKVMPPVRALREVKRGARPQIATVHIMLDDKVPVDKLSDMKFYLNGLSNQLNTGTLLKLEQFVFQNRYTSTPQIASESVNKILIQNSDRTKKIIMEKLPNNTITYTLSTPGSKKEFTHSMYLNNEVSESMKKQNGF